MAKSNQQGFTLIEIVLVVAITGLLLSVAFMGQGQLRAQAHFDAAVNKIVSSVNNAHNLATSGVNYIGSGKGQGACPGAPVNGEYIFAGVAWTADGVSNIRINYYKAVSQSTSANEACIFATDAVTVPTSVTIKSSIDTGAAAPGASELFIRSNDLMTVCPTSTSATVINAAFRSGVCPEGKLTLTIVDSDGRQAVVEVDKSGLAQRKS